MAEETRELAGVILTEPWDVAENLLRKALSDWHTQLQSLHQHFPEQCEKDMQQALPVIAGGIQQLSQAIQSQDVIAASNLLEEILSPVFRELARAVAKQS